MSVLKRGMSYIGGVQDRLPILKKYLKLTQSLFYILNIEYAGIIAKAKSNTLIPNLRSVNKVGWLPSGV
ncbi:MAG: hypothetical protein HC770_03390 [Pseudanabaena sp. CRU_2_10]|nr:hypothetical protein [Pseudanabaena sp. CRU_2_10]